MHQKPTVAVLLFFLLWVFTICPCGVVKAQSGKSAEQKLNNALAEKDPGDGMRRAKEALVSARSSSDHLTEIRCLHYMAQYHFGKGAFDSTRYFALAGLAVAASQRIYALSGDLYTLAGMAEHRTGQYAQAIGFYRKALPIYKMQNSPLSIAVAYLNIGICEKQLANYRTAITYYLTACKLFEATKDSNYLATAYNSVGLCFVSLKDYPKAIDYNRRTLYLRKALNDRYAVSQSMNNLGFAFNAAGNPDS